MQVHSDIIRRFQENQEDRQKIAKEKARKAVEMLKQVLDDLPTQQRINVISAILDILNEI